MLDPQSSADQSPRSRRVRQPGGRGPCDDVTPRRHDPRGCASADGNRASCADVGCWAEKYACSRVVLFHKYRVLAWSVFAPVLVRGHAAPVDTVRLLDNTHRHACWSNQAGALRLVHNSRRTCLIAFAGQPGTCCGQPLDPQPKCLLASAPPVVSRWSVSPKDRSVPVVLEPDILL